VRDPGPPPGIARTRPGAAELPGPITVDHGNTVYASGLVGIDFRTGKPISATDFSARVRQPLASLKEALESAGSSLGRLSPCAVGSATGLTGRR
jgi:enamine deaminase RidA (YjgF/YER057c/UK114 family)